MSFWTETNPAKIREPKRKFRFLVEFTNWADDMDSSILWYAKTATKPSFTIEVGTHNYLNYTFNYPGTVKWNEVTIDLVDPGPTVTGGPDLAEKLWQFLGSSGWDVPGNPNGGASSFNTVSKNKAINGLGSVIITQIDADGVQNEKWTMINAFVTDVKFGELAYGDDELTTYSLTIQYDWAELFDNGVTGQTAAAAT